MGKFLVELFRWLALLTFLLTGGAALAAPDTPTDDFIDNGDGTVLEGFIGDRPRLISVKSPNPQTQGKFVLTASH